jgi:toxin FitB
MSMSGVLFDVCVFSEMVKKTPSANVVKCIADLSTKQVKFYVATSTIESIYFYLAKEPNHSKQILLEKIIEQFEPALPLTAAIAQRAGILRGQFAAAGIERSVNEMLLVATAQAHNLFIATSNVGACLGCGVQTVNPFELK